jgi:hypothetical protein
LEFQTPPLSFAKPNPNRTSRPQASPTSRSGRTPKIIGVLPATVEVEADTYKIIYRLYQEPIMKTNLKRKNYYLDEKKIRRVRAILGTKTETEAIDAALNLVVFRKEILKSLEKVAGKGGVEKLF